MNAALASRVDRQCAGRVLVVSYGLPGEPLKSYDLLGWRSREFIAAAGQRIDPGSQIECCFGIPARPNMQRISGHVHWCSFVEDAWQVGVFLDHPLNDGLDSLRSSDLRAHLRYEVRMPVYVRCQHQRRMVPVTIHNYSREGCAFAGPLTVGVGTELKLHFNDDVAEDTVVDMRIVWSRPFKDGETLYGGSANWITLG